MNTSFDKDPNSTDENALDQEKVKSFVQFSKLLDTYENIQIAKQNSCFTSKGRIRA